MAMSKTMAERVAKTLDGRVWIGDSVVRVYFGGQGRKQSFISSKDDGTLILSLGRGQNESDVTDRLASAGLITGDEMKTSYGTKYLDNVRFIAVSDSAKKVFDL